MLRHLRRFEAAGWKVTVVVEWGQATTECVECGWSVHRLCLRKKWWPPFCSDIRLLRALRMMLWARECHKTLRSDHPCGILTYLSYHSELMSEVAAYFSVITAIPMTVIVYDDVTAFRKSQALASDAITKRYRSILQSASKVWFVSTELAAAYGFPQVEESVLMPIPGGSVNKVAWRNEFSKRPVLTYAGYLYLQQHSMIGRLAAQIASAGGLLLVVSVSKEELLG